MQNELLETRTRACTLGDSLNHFVAVAGLLDLDIYRQAGAPPLGETSRSMPLV